MKRTVSMILAAALLILWIPFALGEQDLHLQMELNDEWQKKGTGYSESGGKIYLHQNGAILIQVELTTEIAVGNEMYQQLYHTAMWPTVLQYVLKNALQAYDSTGDPYEVAMNDGISCCAADTKMLGSPAVAAVFQYDNDLWIVFCLEGKNASAQSVFKKVCGSIGLGRPSDKGTGGSAGRGTADRSDGYTIPEVPVIVHLDDKDLNIYTQDTPADSLTMQRTEKDKATMDWYVGATSAKIVITYPDAFLDEFNIEIRVKDGKYSGLPSWDKVSEEDLSSMMDMIYGNQISPYTVYKTDTATFTVFKMNFDGDAIRYVTIKNGDIIYVHMRRGNGPLTEEDHALIKRVVDSMEFIDQ